MKRLILVALAICLLLNGCGIFDGNHLHIEPHPPEGGRQENPNATANNYQELCAVLSAMAESGVQSGAIAVSNYDQSLLTLELNMAVEETMRTNPVAAWAVESIQWELGTSGGRSAVAVSITYIHDRTEILQISRVVDMEDVKDRIAKELDNCGTGVVLLLTNYQETDFAQLVEDYADENPQSVMETPVVVTNVYPQDGTSRLVELKFNYTTSRDTLRSMQKQVRTVFDSATIFVSGYSQQREKYEALYAFLMDFLAEGDQPLKTSITPAYSLLRHGVGDEKAFATVYAAMCREAGLECHVISGTYNGAPRHWNMICIDGVYSHLDLLRCSKTGAFHTHTDSEMQEYYWDYDAVPQSK